jgi:hypothetical protein
MSVRSAIIGGMSDNLRVPIAVQERAGEVIAITDEVCSEHLDAEYARLARRLVARLARKRPSPLLRGDIRIWAAGVLYVLAQVNFLFDRSQSPHMSAAELAVAAGAKQTSMANKAAMINRLLNIGLYEPELTRGAMLEHHPMAWIVEVNGFLVDARDFTVRNSKPYAFHLARRIDPSQRRSQEPRSWAAPSARRRAHTQRPPQGHS